MDLIGLSSLVGAHNYLFPQVLELLKNQRAEDIALIGGGIFSEENIRTLKQQGVKEIFNHRSSRDSIADWVRENIRPR